MSHCNARPAAVRFQLPDNASMEPYACFTILLSPSEFDSLRELQNTREDNTKKSTSRLPWNTDIDISESVSNFTFENLIPKEGVNYWFRSEPQITILNRDKLSIEYEIERNNLNKSWYEAKNIFRGKIDIERIGPSEIKFIKSYTSQESSVVGDNLQKALVKYFKDNEFVQADKDLIKILFGDFKNEDRITFFYRLSSYMTSNHFTFKDIVI
jgi:hypothetical protein